MESASSVKSKTKLFEFYARNIWPAHRLLVKGQLSQRCSKCFVSEHYSKLENGVCQECLEWPEKRKSLPPPADTSEMEKEFNALMREYEGKGSGKYDALLLVSGGKDSAYLIHKMREQFPGLRILTAFIDNGFASPVALANIQHIVDVMNVDHVTLRPATSLFQKGFHYTLTHIDEKGCYALVDRLDGHLFHDIGRNLAASQRIPLYISGVSWAQIEMIFGVKSFEMPREKELTKRTEISGHKLTKIYGQEEQGYWWDPARYPKEDVSRFVFPMYVWREDEQFIRQEVIRLGLIKKGDDSPLVTNNATIPVMGVVDVNKIGYSSFEPEFAQMVREGKTDRTLWFNIFEMMEYSAKTGFLIGKEITATLNKLGIAKEEVGIRF